MSEIRGAYLFKVLSERGPEIEPKIVFRRTCSYSELLKVLLSTTLLKVNLREFSKLEKGYYL